MRQTAAALVNEQDTDVVAAVGLQGPGGRVGHIAHLVRRLANPVPGLLADVLVFIQGFAYRSDRNAAVCSNVF